MSIPDMHPLNLQHSICVFVQYGAGWCAPAEWRNFDASPTLRFERIPMFGKLYTKNPQRFPENVEYGDIVKGLPVAADMCKAVYCSHVLEHLSLSDFRIALGNTYEIIKPGGVFRLVVPDLEFYAKRYLKSSAHDAALEFLKDTYLGRLSRNRGILGFLKSWFGNSDHLWMWDFKSISEELRNVGFQNIRRADYGDSSLAEFDYVEDADRWLDALGVECCK